MLAQRVSPQLSKMKPAVQWLRDRGVDVAVIADAFGCTRAQVKVLDHRARLQAHRPSGLAVLSWATLARRSGIIRGSYGVRDDEGVNTGPSASRRLDALEEALDHIWGAYGPTIQIDEAIRQLQTLRSAKGYPANARRLRVFGRLSRLLAWFHVHGGRTRTASWYADEAAHLYAFAYEESEERHDLLGMAEAAQINAHAHSLARRPDYMRRALAIAAAALARATAAPNAEFYRLVGVSYFQQGESYDDEARDAFTAAERATREDPAITSDAAVAMNGRRHNHVLGTANAESAYELSSQAARYFGPRSLQASMTLHWSAVASVMTDSQTEHRDAYERVERNRGRAQQFGHQASIALMLGATPRLRLTDASRRAWARYTLYVNAFTNQ